MDEDIKNFSVEDSLRYIKKFIENSSGMYGLTVQYFQGKWRVAVDGIAQIEEQNLKTALGWVCMHIKRKTGESLSYK